MNVPTMNQGTYGCTCPTYWYGIYPPPPCDYCRMNRFSCAPNPWVNTVTLPASSLPQRISDDDVEHIAQRVAELLKGEK